MKSQFHDILDATLSESHFKEKNLIHNIHTDNNTQIIIQVKKKPRHIRLDSIKLLWEFKMRKGGTQSQLITH